MTIEDAIKKIAYDTELMLLDISSQKEANEEVVARRNEQKYERFKADELAIHALEKQVAKKPKGHQTSYSDTALCCPTCMKSVTNYWNRKAKPRYCQFCGQKLKWEDD